MKTLLPLALLVATLTGCTALTTATDAADTAVRLYCSRTPEARTLLREHIATKLKPNRVEIQCAEQ